MKSAVLTAVSAVFLFLGSAQAQMVMPHRMLCGAAKQMIATITEGPAQERPFLQGQVAGGGQRIEVYANPNTGTFSVILYPTAEAACAVLDGVGLKAFSAAKVEKAL